MTEFMVPIQERETFLAYISDWGFNASAFLIRPAGEFLHVVEWETETGLHRLIWEDWGVFLTSDQTTRYHQWQTFPGCDEVMDAWLYHMPLAHEF